MINRIRRNEIIWGFGIISGLWILSIILAGEIHFVHSMSIGLGSVVLSSIFPFAFLLILIWVACVSKRQGMKAFFITSYILAAIPIVSTLPWFLSVLFEDNEAVFSLCIFFSTLFGIPVVSVINAVSYWDGFAWIIFVLSLIISMICYLTLKEKNQTAFESDVEK